MYRRFVFPRLCHLTCSGRRFDRYRRALLAGARGRVLEIGFGSGLNLPCYPPGIERIDAVDPNPGMLRLARRRLATAPAPVELHTLDAERLPFDDGTFATAVSTWTLCSVRDPAAVLAEIHRVLAPGGRFLFLEHGLAPSPGVARWQRRLTPLWSLCADGCHLDRDFAALLAAAPLERVALERFRDPGTSALAGVMYRGAARRGDGTGGEGGPP